MNKRIDRKGKSIREVAEGTGLSTATIRRYTSRSRDEWLAQKAQQREEIRAYHDDEGHSWPETAEHFNLSVSTVKQRAYRARDERDAEELARIQPPLFQDLAS